MKLAIVSATKLEIKPLLEHLETSWETRSLSHSQNKSIEAYPLITIGSMNMAFGISRAPNMNKIDLLIHLGICGSYKSHLVPGKVVEVIREEWADLGAEDADGQFIDGFELGLMDPERFPYSKGQICKSIKCPSTGLEQVSGLSLNCTSGYAPRIEMIKKKYDADVESMEGMGLFYACRMMDLPFVSIRAISNYVEPRNRQGWKMNEAIIHLNQFAISYLDLLVK